MSLVSLNTYFHSAQICLEQISIELGMRFEHCDAFEALLLSYWKSTV